MQKPFYKSKGMIGAVVAFGSSAIALIASPIFHQQASDCLKVFGQNDLANAIATISPVLAMGASVFAGYGRFTAKSSLYTESWMPGPNKIVRDRSSYAIQDRDVVTNPEDAL